MRSVKIRKAEIPFFTLDMFPFLVNIIILSRVGCITRQITSRRMEYSEFIAHSLLHSNNAQLYKFCRLQYHKYFYCSRRLLGFNCTRCLHDPQCVTLDHRLSSHTVPPAFYTAPCCLVLPALSPVTSQWETLPHHRGGGGGGVLTGLLP
jgi:hypothetical protein